MYMILLFLQFNKMFKCRTQCKDYIRVDNTIRVVLIITAVLLLRFMFQFTCQCHQHATEHRIHQSFKVLARGKNKLLPDEIC